MAYRPGWLSRDVEGSVHAWRHMHGNTPAVIRGGLAASCASVAVIRGKCPDDRRLHARVIDDGHTGPSFRSDLAAARHKFGGVCV